MVYTGCGALTLPSERAGPGRSREGKSLQVTVLKEEFIILVCLTLLSSQSLVSTTSPSPPVSFSLSSSTTTTSTTNTSFLFVINPS